MLDNDQIQQVIGSEVVGPDGHKIGRARQVFVDDETGKPTWVSVETGLLGSRASFLPLQDASVTGDRLTVPYDKARVSGAPDHLGEDDHLTPEDEEVLNRYYAGDGADLNDRTDGDRDVADLGDHTDRDRDGVVGDGVVGDDDGDDAITVSEEQLAVSTRSVATERVRLRKEVVTEEVTLTVTLRKERFTVEREPIGEDEVADHVGSTDFADGDSEIVLYEEVPVVQKVVRPVERIRLGTEVTTEQRTVGGEVRKERVEVDDVPLRDDGLSGR